MDFYLLCYYSKYIKRDSDNLEKRQHAPPACPTLYVSRSFLFLLRSYVIDSVFRDVTSRLQSSGDSTIPCTFE
jgi:hypothetical protein